MMTWGRELNNLKIINFLTRFLFSLVSHLKSKTDFIYFSQYRTVFYKRCQIFFWDFLVMPLNQRDFPHLVWPYSLPKVFFFFGKFHFFLATPPFFPTSCQQTHPGRWVKKKNWVEITKERKKATRERERENKYNFTFSFTQFNSTS